VTAASVPLSIGEEEWKEREEVEERLSLDDYVSFGSSCLFVAVLAIGESVDGF
jgi:hypothetical protein